MPSFPIVPGQFTLQNDIPRWLTELIVTCNTAGGGSLKVTGPDGTVIYQTQFAAKGSATLSLQNLPELQPGQYTIDVVGNIVGTISVGNK